MSHKYLLNSFRLVILALILIFPSFADARVSPTRDFFVNDYANVLSYETKNYIQESSSDLYKKDGTQIVVVTVPSLDGESIESYATGIFRDFKIGDAKKNNGLLILLSLEERKVRVEVGYGLEGLFNDAKVGRYLDKYVVPYLKANDFDTGIKQGYDVFYNEIMLTLDTNASYQGDENLSHLMSSNLPVLLFTAFIGILVGYFYALIVENKGNLKGASIGFVVLVLILSTFIPSKLIMLYTRCFFIPFLIMFLLKVLGILSVKYSDDGDYMKRMLDRHPTRGISSSSIFRGGGGSSGGGGASRKF